MGKPAGIRMAPRWNRGLNIYCGHSPPYLLIDCDDFVISLYLKTCGNSIVEMGKFFIDCGGDLLEGDVLHAVMGVGAVSFYSGGLGCGLDDVFEAMIGADDGGIGGAIESDERRVEGCGEVEWAGVIAEGEGRGFQQSEKLG